MKRMGFAAIDVKDSASKKAISGEVRSASLFKDDEAELVSLRVDFKKEGFSEKTFFGTVSDIMQHRPLDGFVPERIVRNGPALIVFWDDTTKTVVKCHDEDFDAEKGLAMALARKLWGRSRTVAMLKKVEEQ